MELMKSVDLRLWERSLAVYKDIVSLLSDEKRKRKKGKVVEEDDLYNLDQWYQEELPSIVTSRDPPHLTHEELCHLMKWKLTRGKFRPRLTELIKQNDEKTVIEVTTEAYSQIPNLQKAIETLTKLKAVGPATASAVLCVVHPQYAPFMADESAQSIQNLGRLDYSLKQYLIYADVLQDRAKELGPSWTAHQVELSLWSYHFAIKFKPELLSTAETIAQESNETTPPKKKRKVDDH